MTDEPTLPPAFKIGDRVAIMPPAKGHNRLDCSALRIEQSPSDQPILGICVSAVRPARYHDEPALIAVDFDVHGRADCPVALLSDAPDNAAVLIQKTVAANKADDDARARRGGDADHIASPIDDL